MIQRVYLVGDGVLGLPLFGSLFMLACGLRWDNVWPTSYAPI